MGIFRKIKLWHKVTFGLVAGIIVGVFLGADLHFNIGTKIYYFKDSVPYIKVIGDIFIRLIKMIIVPLIYLSIVIGMTSMNDSSSLSRVATKSIIAFLLTTSFAIVIGLSAAYFFQPGKGIALDIVKNGLLPKVQATRDFSLMKIIDDTIPDNALNALVSGNMLQVVFFSFFTGMIIAKMGKEKRLISSGLKLAAEVVFKMIHFILELAPYAAFALTTSVVATQGLSALQNLGMLVLTLLIALFVQYMLFGVMIAIFARLSPFPFYKKSLEYQALAFSTSSSKATLATTMDVCSNKLGISKNSTSFVLPLGAAINMDGMAIYLGICTLFFAQAYGISLTAIDYAVIILTSTLGSIGAAGIPSGTIIMLPMVLSSVSIPIEGIALIVGIDRILDMLRTTLNITGDATITLIIDKTEGTLNKLKYYAKPEKLAEGESPLFK